MDAEVVTEVVTVALSIGQLIAERYRLIRRIAVGGMGEVWESSDTRLARRVAIKVLKAELSGSPEFLQRFRVEARTTASLNHPGIAAVHDYGETAATVGGPADTAYLVMELVEGEPLAAMIARRRRLSPERTLDVLEQAGNALQAAHQRGLVHRDVKPGNILLTAMGTVKLTDFGIAKAVDAAPVTRSGMVMGTAHYIAPEQATGQEAGPASDVYALGVVGYECLTGHRPFLSDNAVTVAVMHIRDTPPSLPPDTPPGVRALIDATLVKDPRARYATGGEFAAAVAAVRAGRPLPRPGSAVLQVPPLRGGAVLGVPPLPGRGPSDDPPTGPQRRYAPARPATVAVGPPTPNPPASSPFVPPQPRSRQLHRAPPTWAPGATPLLGIWILAGVLLAVGLAIGAWVTFALLDNNGGNGDNRGGGPSVTFTTPAQQSTTTRATPHNVTVDVDHYRDRPAADVADELARNGLQPEVLDQDDNTPNDPTTCLVTDIRPAGEVPSGDSVTVFCQQKTG